MEMKDLESIVTHLMPVVQAQGMAIGLLLQANPAARDALAKQIPGSVDRALATGYTDEQIEVLRQFLLTLTGTTPGPAP